jgi:hypothetical protein
MFSIEVCFLFNFVVVVVVVIVGGYCCDFLFFTKYFIADLWSGINPFMSGTSPTLNSIIINDHQSSSLICVLHILRSIFFRPMNFRRKKKIKKNFIISGS